MTVYMTAHQQTESIKAMLIMTVYMIAHQWTESIKAMLIMFLIYLQWGENASTCRYYTQFKKTVYSDITLMIVSEYLLAVISRLIFCLHLKHITTYLLEELYKWLSSLRLWCSSSCHIMWRRTRWKWYRNSWRGRQTGCWCKSCVQLPSLMF